MLRRLLDKFHKIKDYNDKQIYIDVPELMINFIIAFSGFLFIAHNKTFGALFVLLCSCLALDNILEGRGRLATKITIILYVICIGFILFSKWSNQI